MHGGHIFRSPVEPFFGVCGGQGIDMGHLTIALGLSLSGHIFIEAPFPNGDWYLVAELRHCGDVRVMSLLSHPWGRWVKGDTLPKPVASLRGVPRDISFLTRHQYTWSVTDALGQGESRQILRRDLPKLRRQGFKRFQGTTVCPYYVDPAEWRGGTWLTLPEVREAFRRYRGSGRRSSPELAAMLGVMRAYEGSRAVVWYGSACWSRE